jgi:hypothetical protein
MTFVRILRTTRVTMSHTFYVDGVATDATGTPTVSIKRLDGTEVATPSVSHSGVGTGTYTYVFPEQAQLDTLQAIITATVAGAPIEQSDWVEIVGAFLFGLAEARNMPPVLSAVQWPDEVLAQRRISTEMECERICGQAFVPRFGRVALSGNNRAALVLPRSNIRAVRSITLDGALQTADAYTWTRSGVIARKVGWWTVGSSNVIVEFEYGMDYPPPDLTDAAMLRLRSRIAQGKSEIPSRASSYTVQGGGVYRLSMPTREKTGHPDVDGVYEGYTPVEAGFA